MAKTMASDLVKYNERVVVLLLFHRRDRLVLCEAFKRGFVYAVYMPMGWLPFGWWSIADTYCTPAQVTSQALGFTSANMTFWRSDLDTTLTCSTNMTARMFIQEWCRDTPRGLRAGSGGRDDCGCHVHVCTSNPQGPLPG